MSATVTPTPIGIPNTAGSPTTRADQAVATARDLPDLIQKASALDPDLAAKFTGKSLLASKTFYGSILVIVVTEVARRYSLGWDPTTVDIVAGAIDLAALSALRAMSEHPITGWFRAATPAEIIEKAKTAVL